MHKLRHVSRCSMHSLPEMEVRTIHACYHGQLTRGYYWQEESDCFLCMVVARASRGYVAGQGPASPTLSCASGLFGSTEGIPKILSQTSQAVLGFCLPEATAPGCPVPV